jgi:hypothetical protein
VWLLLSSAPCHSSPAFQRLLMSQGTVAIYHDSHVTVVVLKTSWSTHEASSQHLKRSSRIATWRPGNSRPWRNPLATGDGQPWRNPLATGDGQPWRNPLATPRCRTLPKGSTIQEAHRRISLGHSNHLFWGCQLQYPPYASSWKRTCT